MSPEAVHFPYLMDMLAGRIAARTGLHFPPVKWRDLQTGIARMTETLQLSHEIDCINWLMAEPWGREKEMQCAQHLTIAETYFFREPRAFELLCEHVTGKIADASGSPGQLRIWSAGCCTGEEPYSIAMALANAFPRLDAKRVSILATDLNPHYLEHARAARYRHWSFRSICSSLQRLYFTEESDGQFRLKKAMRERVKFVTLNLAEPVFPSALTDTHAMDIIFCRNVLMYFSREQAIKVIQRFHQCLVPGGWLVVSPSEASSEMFAGFTGSYFPDAIFYRKNALTSAPNGTPVATAPPAATPATTDFPAPLPLMRASASTLQSALALADAGQSADAMLHLEQALAMHGEDVALYHAKALVALQAGDQDTALHSLRQVLYLQPDFILAHYLMGVVQAAGHRHQQAMRQFETAQKLLAALPEDQLVPGSDGLTAGYLMHALNTMMQKESA